VIQSPPDLAAGSASYNLHLTHGPISSWSTRSSSPAGCARAFPPSSSRLPLWCRWRSWA